MLTRRTALALPALATAVAAQPDQRPALRIAVQALPPTLEPLESISNVGLRITYNVFDTLIRRDFVAEAQTGRAVLRPHLATAWRRPDPLTWEFDLRPGVRLHDGNELTAEDVAATMSEARMWGAQAPYFEGRVNFGHLRSVEATGPRTVRIVTRAPDVVMEHRLAAYGGWIASHRFIAAQGEAGMRRAPAGCGPYRVADFSRDQRVVLDAHDDYWMGRPPARRITFQVVPEASSRVAGLMAGDFDLVTNLLPDQMPAINRSREVEAVGTALDFAHVLYFDTRRPFLSDVRVRRALNHALDRETMGRALWGEGFRPMAAQQIPAFGDYFDAGRRGLAFDPDLARRLLREAGYAGQELVLRIPGRYYLNLLEAAQIIEAMWRAVRVNARLEVIENIAQLTNPGADIRPTSIAFRFPDPLGGGLSVHWARGFFIQDRGFWSPVRYNEILDALRAAAEPAERRRLWIALLDEWDAEAPGVLLYSPLEIIGKRRAIRWRHPPLYYMDFRTDSLAFGA